MREILFRGKRIDNGEWVFGDFVGLNDGARVIPHIYGCGEIILSTLGQYTGLTDKNGKKIFEGDILRFKNDDGEYFYFCTWSSEESGWVVKRHEKYGELPDALDAFFCENTEVIGNIHDNPELLEVSGDE